MSREGMGPTLSVRKRNGVEMNMQMGALPAAPQSAGAGDASTNFWGVGENFLNVAPLQDVKLT